MPVRLLDDPTSFLARDWTALVRADPKATFFHTPGYLKLWWEEFGSGGLVIAIADDGGEPAAVCCFQVEDGLLTFLGGLDVTDYMGPVGLPGLEGPLAKDLLGAVAAGVEWDRADLRGLPADSPWHDALEAAAVDHGLRVEREEDGICPVLPLPATYDAYLGALPAKLRHEIRRKERRLRGEFGDYLVEFCTAETLPTFYDRFIELHRQSPGPKGKFMHAGMEIFFRRLGEAFIADHVFHLGFIEIAGVKAAGFIGFAHKDTFFLYNSAFDREFFHFSPGMVLIADMIERAIGDGRHTFDLLKGDLDYKYRFGASPRPLGRLSLAR